MTEKIERPFSETWALLGATVELAGQIVAASPTEILSFTAGARTGVGTGAERSLLSAMIAMRQGALAQIELADAAIAMLEIAAQFTNETAMAELSDGPAN